MGFFYLFLELNWSYFVFLISRRNYPLILTRSFRFNRHNINLRFLLPLWVSETSESTGSLIFDSLFKKLFYRYVNIAPVKQNLKPHKMFFFLHTHVSLFLCSSAWFVFTVIRSSKSSAGKGMCVAWPSLRIIL